MPAAPSLITTAGNAQSRAGRRRRRSGSAVAGQELRAFDQAGQEAIEKAGAIWASSAGRIRRGRDQVAGDDGAGSLALRLAKKRSRWRGIDAAGADRRPMDDSLRAGRPQRCRHHRNLHQQAGARRVQRRPAAHGCRSAGWWPRWGKPGSVGVSEVSTPWSSSILAAHETAGTIFAQRRHQAGFHAERRCHKGKAAGGAGRDDIDAGNQHARLILRGLYRSGNLQCRAWSGPRPADRQASNPPGRKVSSVSNRRLH